ncbi:MAG TPA: alcohol dehydrogenase catalytic domain-containing protein, partial [Lacipirellulaceae bacterium]|nr:alcohol dehydrogenase catalytic domain-containing protein [Lacipirellulaceae bacterium]
MQAVIYDAFGVMPYVAETPDPEPAADGAVIAVAATGLCRSDWHGWQGHDADIRRLPHVPGHEWVGTIVAVGRDVARWRPGARVTMPFVAGCGQCVECREGAPQVCPAQYQPGFSGWGSFAEFVGVRYADFNLVPAPAELDDLAAAALGCRLATAYRAVALQAAVQPGEWIAVHGCGGVGLSAIMVAAARGARPIAVDVSDAALALARQFGAEHVGNPRDAADAAEA